MKKNLLILVLGIFALSFPSLTLPDKAQADEEKYSSGCCQFFVDNQPGCLYPSSPDPCANNLNGKFLEGSKCDADTGYCSGYAEDESAPSEPGK